MSLCDYTITFNVISTWTQNVAHRAVSFSSNVCNIGLEDSFLTLEITAFGHISRLSSNGVCAVVREKEFCDIE